MINKDIDKTLDLLVQDGEFLGNFENKLESFASPSTTKEEQNQMIRQAWKFLFHIIDYYVTFHLFDMDADLYRLCQKDPVKASKVADSLQKAAFSMKVNYQSLCKEGTIYDKPGINGFVPLYIMALDMRLQPSGDKMLASLPMIFLTYEDIEFFSVGGDQNLIKQKLKACQGVHFTLDTIKEFISNCFRWADEMNFALKSMQSERTIVDIDPHKLERVYEYCKDVAFNNLTLEQFAAAIRNIDKPKHCIQNADCFYALVLALYNAMGPLGSRDRWLTSVLQNFELESSNYYNAKRRIEKKETAKLCKRYNIIMELLSE